MSKFSNQLQVQSPEEMQCFGRCVALHLRGGEVIGLRGELGAGKTEFVRGLAEGLGADAAVSSPTFVLEIQYACKAPNFQGTLHHWDMYRLAGEGPPEELREQCGDIKRVVAVEWPERFAEALNLLSCEIVIDTLAQEDVVTTIAAEPRVLRWSCHSDEASQVLQRAAAKFASCSTSEGL